VVVEARTQECDTDIDKEIRGFRGAADSMGLSEVCCSVLFCGQFA
jgi:hypothetical protein